MWVSLPWEGKGNAVLEEDLSPKPENALYVFIIVCHIILYYIEILSVSCFYSIMSGSADGNMGEDQTELTSGSKQQGIGRSAALNQTKAHFVPRWHQP